MATKAKPIPDGFRTVTPFLYVRQVKEHIAFLQKAFGAEQITGKKIAVEMGPRRPGDPPTLVASSEKVRKELGWKPKREKLETIVESAWRWMQRAKPTSKN